MRKAPEVVPPAIFPIAKRPPDLQAKIMPGGRTSMGRDDVGIAWRLTGAGCA